jgi:hypothetical protein
MDMPRVSECLVSGCAYNLNGVCHALAITIGDGIHPHCDTFCQAPRKGGDINAVAGVGACKVAECQYNQSLECNAPGICVGYHERDIECLTYCHR